jgi:hypothetical protein
MIFHLYHKVRFAILKKKIKKNPHIGQENIDGTYDYKQGSYGIRYCIAKEASAKESIQWVSRRRHLSAYEQNIKGIKRSFFKFWHYQGWLSFLSPPIIFLLFISIVIFYFGLMETQKTKVERFKWIVASVVGISPHQIEYIGDGWLDISGQRRTAVDRIYEPIRYMVNPFRWFFSSEAGFVTRWRGESYGYVTHPIVYNERGDVWLNKEGNWIYGKISGKEVNWDVPQGTGIRAGKVIGHEIPAQDKKLYIKDK